MINGLVAGLESSSKRIEMFTLNKIVLVEFLGILLKFTSGSSLSLEVFVAILEFLIRLASIIIEQVAPNGDEATDEPQIAVTLDEASITSDAKTDSSESQNRVDFPGMEGGWVLHAKSIVDALTFAN